MVGSGFRLTSVALLGLLTIVSSPARADLIGTNVSIGSVFQATKTSPVFATTSTVSVPVSATAVEIPSFSAYAIANGSGTTVINSTVDVNANTIVETYLNAGSGTFAVGYQNVNVFTFTSSALVGITGAIVDPSTNIAISNTDLTFSGNQLFVNVGRGGSFNPRSRLQIDLVVSGGPNGMTSGGSTSVPEPATLALVTAGLVGLTLTKKRRQSR